jgi:tyrosyl-DNA phosphodiesterase 2
MTMQQVSTVARELLGCQNVHESTTSIALYMKNFKSEDKRVDWKKDPNALVRDMIPKQSTVHCAIELEQMQANANNSLQKSANDGRKRNTAAISLLEDDSDDDDDVVEVVSVVKRRRDDDNKEATSSTQPTTSDNSRKPAASNTATKMNGQQPRAGATSLQFNVATYNVWFEVPPHPQERMLALAEALFSRHTATKPLLFVGFQEVTDQLWATLKPLMEAKGYTVFCQDLNTMRYGCAIAILQTKDARGGQPKILSHGWQPYQNTIMGRGFLHARVQLPHSNQQILLTTTHLESFVRLQDGRPPYTGARERKLQINELEAFCMKQQDRYPDLSLALISGDLNWDDDRAQSKPADDVLAGPDGVLTTGWKDTWFPVREERRQAVADRNGKVKKKDEPQCYTYDAKENPMLGGNLRRRFDRILLRRKLRGDAKLQLQIEDVELIGKDPIPGLTWTKVSSWNGRETTKVVPVLPSDHYGYVVTVNADYN